MIYVSLKCDECPIHGGRRDEWGIHRIAELRPRVGGIGFGVTDDPGPAHPDERLLAGCLPAARQPDFLLGRAALRLAITDACLSCGPVGIDGRRPALPPGIVGSLSHSGGLAVAIAGPSVEFAALGVDLERVALPVAAAHLVLGPGERAWVDGDEGRLLAAFSAKEAVFKAVSGIAGVDRLRDIRLRATGGGFAASVPTRPELVLPVAVHALGDTVFSWTMISRKAADG